jgi:hypothetical protein
MKSCPLGRLAQRGLALGRPGEALAGAPGARPKKGEGAKLGMGLLGTLAASTPHQIEGPKPITIRPSPGQELGMRPLWPCTGLGTLYRDRPRIRPAPATVAPSRCTAPWTPLAAPGEAKLAQVMRFAPRTHCHIACDMP